jgi:hypothetical protein
MTVIIEQTAIPEVMATLSAFVKVKVIATIELVQTVKDIFASMRMDNIQKDGQTKAMGGIDKLFQIFRCSISGTGSKKACHLVPKCCQICISTPSKRNDNCSHRHNKHVPLSP